MIRILSMKLAALLFAALALPPILKAESITYTAAYDCSKLTIGTDTLGGETYSTVHYEGLYNTGTPGQPSLPVQFLKFSVPYNAVNITVQATSTVGEVYQINYPVLPCQGNMACATMPDSRVYNSSAPFPGSVAWVVDEGMVAGENHVVTVAVAPVSYSLGHQLNMMESVSLTLSYELGGPLGMYPLVRDGQGLRERGFEKTRSLVTNPHDVTNNAMAVPPILSRGYDLIPDETIADPATYLIVSTPAMYHPLRRLAALKMQMGIDVGLVTLNEVLNDPVASVGDSIPQGDYSYVSYTDDAGKLRQYLRERYLHNGTEYVLLAGKGIPSRYKWSGQADMYFSNLYTDWMYGESKYSTIQVGRLLGNTATQCDNYVDKLLRYGLNPGNGNYSYLRRALVLESKNHDSESYGLIDNFERQSLDVTLMSEHVNGVYPTGGDVIDSISSNHYGFMASFNDGAPSYIQLYGPDTHGDSFYLWSRSEAKDAPGITDTETGNGLDQMNNESFPMVYLSLCGKTIPYDSYENYNVEVNFGESFTMGKDYGGPVYMGMTGGNTDGDDNYLFANWFSDAIGSGSKTLGDAYYDTKQSYSTTDWEVLVCNNNYLGDPALDMWTDTPQKYSNITVGRTNNSVTVSGITANGTTVAYHSNDGTTGWQTATTSTLTLNNVSPNSTIMLYKHNYIPYIAPLVLQNTTLDNSQYVIAGDVTAGRSVDSGRASGKVTVAEGVEYEIEASGEVTLAGGFTVEKGATFSVRPSTYK